MSLLLTLWLALAARLFSFALCSVSKVQAATRYHERETQRLQSYYQERAGQEQSPVQMSSWHGALAARFGLTPDQEVSGKHFDALLRGLSPINGRPLGQHQAHPDKLRQYAVDATFSWPKAFSILYVLSTGEAHQALHAAAIRATRAGLDYLAAPRRRGQGGKHHDYDVERIAAMFVHVTSRSGDPHVHSHVVEFLFGRSRDGSIGRLESKIIFEKAHAAGAIARSALAHELRKLGLVVQPMTSYGLASFTIEGVPRPLEEALSTRSEQVRTTMAERGLEGPKAAEATALNTREAKDFNPAQLIARTRAAATEHGLTSERLAQLLSFEHRPQVVGQLGHANPAVPQAIQGAIQECLAKHSTFEPRHLVRATFERLQTGCDTKQVLEAIELALDSHPSLEQRGSKRGVALYARSEARQKRETEREPPQPGATTDVAPVQMPELVPGVRNRAPARSQPTAQRTSVVQPHPSPNNAQYHNIAAAPTPQLQLVAPRPQPNHTAAEPGRRRLGLGFFVGFLLRPRLERNGSTRVLVAESAEEARQYNAAAQRAARRIGMLGLETIHVAHGARASRGDRVRLRWGYPEAATRADLPYWKRLRSLFGLAPVRAARGEHGLIEKIVTKRSWFSFRRRTVVIRLDVPQRRGLFGLPHRRIVLVREKKAAQALELGYACTEAQAHYLFIEPVRPHLASPLLERTKTRARDWAASMLRQARRGESAARLGRAQPTPTTYATQPLYPHLAQQPFTQESGRTNLKAETTCKPEMELRR